MRYPVDFPVRWTKVSGENSEKKFHGTVTNISKGGLFLKSDTLFPADDRLEILIDHLDHNKEFNVHGYVKAILDGPPDSGITTGMGIMFDSQDKSARLMPLSSNTVLLVARDIPKHQKIGDSDNRDTQILKNIIESLTYPFLIINVDDYSVAMANSSSSSRNQNRTTTCYNLLHSSQTPCHHTGLPCPIEIIKRTKKPAVVEHIHTEGHDKYKFVEVNGYPVFDDSGNVKQIIEYIIDITERKQTEIAFQQNEIRYKQLVDYSPVAIMTHQDGRFTMANASTLRLFGAQNEQELIGTPIIDRVHPEYRNIVKERVKGLTEDNLIQAPSIEEKLLKLNGDTIFAEVEATSYEYQGKPTVQIVAIDITERKKLEKQLYENEERLRLALDATQIGIWDWKPKNDIWFASSIYFSMLGYAPDSERQNNETWINRRHPDDREFYIQTMAAVSAGELTEFDIEYRVLHADGSYRWINSVGHGIEFDAVGKTLRMLGLQIDITDRKRSELEREVIYDITTSVTLTTNLDELYQSIHQALKKVLYAENCFITLYDKKTELFSFPYYIDQFDKTSPPVPPGKSCYDYVFRTGQPLLMDDTLFDQLAENGEVELVGTPSPSWLGVPLNTPTETIGVVVLQHYEDNFAYSERDTKFLASVGGQIATAIERVRAKDNLKESELKYRTMIETANDLVWTLDTEGNFTFINKSAEVITGHSISKLIGKGFGSLIHPKDLSIVHDTFSRTLEGNSIRYDVRILNADGKILILSVNTLPEFKDNKIIGTVSFGRDITSRIKAEEELVETRDYLDNLFNYANAPIIVWDTKFRITRFNPAFELLTGRSAKEVIGKSLKLLFPSENVKSSMEMINEAQKGNRWQTVEINILHVDGSVCVVIWNSASVLGADGKTPIATIAQGQDITERKHAEEKLKEYADHLEEMVKERTAGLETVNKELESFSYSVSHDLRAPIRSIEGWNSALMDEYGEQLDEQAHQYLNRVRDGAVQMDTLIKDLLSLSRIGRSDLQVQTIDLTAIVHNIIAKLNEQEPNRKVKISISPNLKAEADSHLLEIALTNLLGNAWKFTGPRTPAHIEFGKIKTNGQPTYFVKDNGVGFDMEYADNLFGAFQRLHTDLEFEGTGIGLAIVQRIIHRHGGSVWAESELGKGTTFFFTLS